MLDDPTMATALRIWGEPIALHRTPAVSFDGIYSEPDQVRQFGALQVDDVDGQLAVLTATIAPLALQVGERVTLRGQTFRMQAVIADDGAGSALWLKKVKA